MNLIMKEEGKLYDVDVETFYKEIEAFLQANAENEQEMKQSEIKVDLPLKLRAIKQESVTKLRIEYRVILHEQKMYRKLYMRPDDERIITEDFYAYLRQKGLTEEMEEAIREGKQSDELFTYRNRNGVLMAIYLQMNASGTYRIHTQNAVIYPYTPNMDYGQLLERPYTTKGVVLPNVYEDAKLCWGEAYNRKALETNKFQGVDKFSTLFFTNYFNTHLNGLNITKTQLEQIKELMQAEAENKPLFKPLYANDELYTAITKERVVYRLLGLCNILQIDVGRIEQILQQKNKEV